MVLASHVIFSAYGFWLPNDPSGSWSEFVGAWELFRFGPATKVETTRSVARVPHNRQLRLAAKEALKYRPVVFTGVQARAIGQAFGTWARDQGVTIHACAILPEHVHMVIARHRYGVEYVVNQLKGAATRDLVEQKLHPFLGMPAKDRSVPMCWARKLWKVFLDSPEDILRAIRYVENNPVKEGRRRQNWSFITRYV